VVVVDERAPLGLEGRAARDVHLDDALEREALEAVHRREAERPLVDREVRDVEQDPAVRLLGDSAK
jgi:hypothetical protein